MAADDSPIPLSFPAILNNPRLKHLHNQPSSSHRHQTKPSDPSDPHHRIPPVGRRRQHRFDNARFASNPHIAKPTPRDFQLWQPDPPIRFTTPPPRGYPRSLYVPPVEPMPFDGFSSRMGAFNRSLKGVRRSIRRSLGDLDPHPSSTKTRLEEFLSRIDGRLATWIDTRTVWTSSLTDPAPSIIDPGPWPHQDPIKRHQPSHQPAQDPVDPRPSILEISRSPYTLKWSVPDRYGRFLVHCVARYYGIVSFSPHSNPGRSSIGSTTTIAHDQDADPNSSYPPSSIVCMIKAHLPTRRGSRINGHQSPDTPPLTDLDSEHSSAEAFSEGSGAPSDDDHHLSSDDVLRNPPGSSTLALSSRSSADEHVHSSPIEKGPPNHSGVQGTQPATVEDHDGHPSQTGPDRVVQAEGWTPTSKRSVDLLTSRRSPLNSLNKPDGSSNPATPRVSSIHLDHAAERPVKLSFLEWVRT